MAEAECDATEKFLALFGWRVEKNRRRDQLDKVEQY